MYVVDGHVHGLILSRYVRDAYLYGRFKELAPQRSSIYGGKEKSLMKVKETTPTLTIMYIYLAKLKASTHHAV